MSLRRLVYKGPSEIHGTGLFARRQIEQGSFIGTYSGPRVRRDGTYVLWVCEEGEAPIGRSGRNLLRYLNHAKDCNARFDGFDLYAVRRIEKDEEITFDYGW
jgi:SET domain-containing protein